MVYDLIYDDNGNIVNALLINGIHGKGQHYIKTKIPTSIKIGNKISFGTSNHFLYYNSKLNTDYDNGLIEGCINLVNIKSSSGWKSIATSSKKNEYSILRFINHDENGKAILNYHGSEYNENIYNNEEIYLLDKSKERLKYNRLYIEKTVDVHTYDVVVANDELTYTIIIKNNSNKNYTDDILVTENISDYVIYQKYEINKQNVIFNEDLDNKKIEWNIGKLNSGEEVIIKYSVRVREKCFGETIESNGTVGNIPSSIVKNKIGNKLTETQANSVQEKYDELRSKFVGKELVNEIYKEAFGIDLKFDTFNITNLVKNTKKDSISSTTAVLNKDDIFYNFVLNNYWSTLYRKPNNYQSQGDVIAYDLKDWQEYCDEDRRADTIYGENFVTGDILIYKNDNDVLYNYENSTLTTTPVTYEDGEYAYIYIEGRGFVGVNHGNDGIAGTQDDRNEFTPKYYSDNGLSVYSNTSETDEEILEFANYQTLLGKDYYCILRPTIAVDLVPMKLKIDYSNINHTNQDVEVTITSNEEMWNVGSWELSQDKRKLTKKYSKNMVEKLKVYDYGGNERNVDVKVENIDKEEPIVNINYSTTKTTNKDVVVTINSNEKIRDINGWTMSEDKKVLTKKYTENKIEFIEIIDLAGNSIIAKIKIENIDKTKSNTITLSKTAFTYNKKVQKPTITVKGSDGKEITASNYTVTYSNKNSKKIGEYKVTITFKGNYEGTKTFTYKINPKGTSLKKLTKGRKQFKATWKAQKKETTGYELQYATNKKFTSGKKKVTIKKNKTTSSTVKKLKTKKKYYVRIRTYKTVNGKKFYSGWSKVLNVKI